jgi:hypothetical protein
MYKTNTTSTLNNQNKLNSKNKSSTKLRLSFSSYRNSLTNTNTNKNNNNNNNNNNYKSNFNTNTNNNTLTINNINTDFTYKKNKLKNFPSISIRPYSAKKNSKNFLILSTKNKKYKPSDFQRHFCDEPLWKKTLKGKFLHLLKNNIILNEDKFNPLSFVESIAPKVEGEFKNKFKPLDDRLKVNIFTNNFPSVLLCNEIFYTRYFDYFLSIDELLKKNFTEEEIFQIKSDPFYFKFDNKYNNVDFFKKKSLTEQLNEEEKIGYKKIVKHDLKESLKNTSKKIRKYLDYYTYVMSQKDFISNRYLVRQRNKQNFIQHKDEEYKF